MPETAIHKDRNPFFEENKIGIAWEAQRLHVPSRYPRSDQSKPEAQLSGSIATPANGAEVFRRSDSYAAEHSTREMLAKGPFHLRFQFNCFCLLCLPHFWLFGFFFTAVEYQYLVPINLAVRRRKVGLKLFH
jgi:hypothetical protein